MLYLKLLYHVKNNYLTVTTLGILFSLLHNYSIILLWNTKNTFIFKTKNIYLLETKITDILEFLCTVIIP